MGFKNSKLLNKT